MEEDELAKLLTRIFLLKSKIRSQVEALDQHRSATRNLSKPPQTKNNHETLKDLFETQEEKEQPPATLKFLRVNYNDKINWLSPNPLADEKETWITAPSIKRPTESSKTCEYCRYKEGLEEVLNILSVCGFIKKPKKEINQDFPNTTTDPLIEQESYTLHSKSMTTRSFRRKSGIEPKTYY